jgi:hypothetical protein
MDPVDSLPTSSPWSLHSVADRRHNDNYARPRWIRTSTTRLRYCHWLRETRLGFHPVIGHPQTQPGTNWPVASVTPSTRCVTQSMPPPSAQCNTPGKVFTPTADTIVGSCARHHGRSPSPKRCTDYHRAATGHDPNSAPEGTDPEHVGRRSRGPGHHCPPKGDRRHGRRLDARSGPPGTGSDRLPPLAAIARCGRRWMEEGRGSGEDAGLG